MLFEDAVRLNAQRNKLVVKIRSLSAHNIRPIGREYKWHSFSIDARKFL